MTATYQGEDYPIYVVPIDGATRQLMLIEPGRESSVFVDPTDPSRRRSNGRAAGGRSSRPGRSSPHVENFTTAWNQLNFPRLLFNTVRDRRS